MDKNLKLNEGKILNEYFDYLKSEEATIVYIAKNLVENLDPKKKWIDVIDFDCWGSRGEKPAFNYIILELFERKIHPKYPDNASAKLRNAITWRTCHDDIGKQRSKGICGSIFLITCHLFNKNKGKTEIKLYHNWNEEYGLNRQGPYFNCFTKSLGRTRMGIQNYRLPERGRNSSTRNRSQEGFYSPKGC